MNSSEVDGDGEVIYRLHKTFRLHNQYFYSLNFLSVKFSYLIVAVIFVFFISFYVCSRRRSTDVFTKILCSSGCIWIEIFTKIWCYTSDNLRYNPRSYPLLHLKVFHLDRSSFSFVFIKVIHIHKIFHYHQILSGMFNILDFTFFN